MAKLGFYFNGDRCIGCRACQIACKDKNDLVVGILFRQVRSYETGSYPTPGYFHHSSTCNHCERPACVLTCPSGALHVAEYGIIQLDVDICIGCQNCVRSCPYGVPQYYETKETAAKCDFCVDLITKGDDPACVIACPQRALEWGPLSELIARHPDALRDLPFLPSSTQTNPSTIITPRICSLAHDYRQKQI